VTPWDNSNFPHEVSISTAFVEADPRDPPELVLGSADTTSQRCVSIAIVFHHGIPSTKPPNTRMKTPVVPQSAFSRREYFFRPVGSAFVSMRLLVITINPHSNGVHRSAQTPPLRTPE
jgi:hypothetical protein